MTIPAPAATTTGETPSPKAPVTVGRSPSQLMWLRFRRDRTGLVSAGVVIFFLLVAILAPVISMLYGKDPYTLYGQENPGLLNDYGYPVLPNGGISSEFWFGIEPGLGRDVFTQLVYGIRTSLAIAMTATVLISIIGIVMGIVAGYAGGRTDYFIGRLIDIVLSFPSTLFIIAFIPVVENLFVKPDENTPIWLRVVTLIGLLTAFGWAGIARLLRGQVLSMREREFVEAAKVTGASPSRIIFKELLPNLWTPILIQSTLLLPAMVTAEAALSFLGVGMIEPIPDWGRMFRRGTEIYMNDITYLIFPGVALLVFVVAFNLLGDSIRDAFDPKLKR
ncbi:peptide/nickel transport system permease protein [Streptosporangium becharense]|uniref:Peptide/nickel transport system permease protein n=1 Tax=Streptosporangium becharense TaxID=1816182 RepID=A0A7W9ID51_9ACTN|nr:ABC transporter permease [Streptosporangium becharense]MBB2912830.1 peptide/nickel transport system permease protein [Streptosporangium becharense]MBB5818345.1 peptide/nickel transport system permease protein [Streptosporangium becharense]